MNERKRVAYTRKDRLESVGVVLVDQQDAEQPVGLALERFEEGGNLLSPAYFRTSPSGRVSITGDLP